MTYTFKITDTSPQSLSIINMLISLAADYDFIQMVEEPEIADSNELTPEQAQELDRRYQNFILNPYHGKSQSQKL